MKSTLKLLFAAALLVAGQLLGADVTLTSGYMNRYMGFSSGNKLSDKATLQSDAHVAFGSGVYVDLWDSTPLNSFDSKGKDFRKEIDYGVGYVCTVRGFGVNVGETYFDEPSLGAFGASDVWYTHAKLSHELTLSPFGLEPITVFGQYENYKTMPGTGYEGGSLFSLGANANRAYRNVSVNVTQAFTYDDGGFGSNERLLAKMVIGVTWKVSEHFSLIAPQVFGYLPITDTQQHDPEAMVYIAGQYQF